jgi:hypothetical protein
MRTAVEFNREFGGVAIEINDVPSDHLLPTKVKSINRISAKGPPEPALRGRHFAAQLFGEC